LRISTIIPRIHFDSFNWQGHYIIHIFCKSGPLVMPSYSQLEIRSLQLEDHDLQPMIAWLESKQTPTDSVLRLHGPATRALWLCRDCLVFREGVLYYQWIERPDKDLCLVVPQNVKVNSFHGEPCVEWLQTGPWFYMDFLILIACVTCFDILNTVLRHVVPYKRLLHSL
jgi:hypothetical protein